MGVAAEVNVAPATIGDMRVQLGGAEIGVAQHLLHAAQVGPTFEQVRGERMPQQVRVDALGLEARAAGRRRRIRKAPARVRAPPCALRKSSGRCRLSR